MNSLYVVGGRQRPGVSADVEEWHHYGTAVIAAVDVDTGVVESRVEYVTPPEACAAGDDPSIVFKTATVSNSRMYVPTQTEILVYDLPTFRQSGYISLPCFNDVHHVRPGPNGTLIVANTGLDMVLEIAEDGRTVREWSVNSEELWTRFSRDVDYRKVVSTKPHHSHPNNVWYLGGELWVTRCDQKDLHCLTRDQPAVPIADRWIHDGLVAGTNIYFTSVNGAVIIVDAVTMEVKRRLDLNAIAGGDPPLGWCRGIEMLDEDHAVVGFSRLRPTRWKQNIQWAKHRLGAGSGRGLSPTRIAMFDLKQEKMCWDIDLEPAGMNVVFSIHNADGG
jgi:hypothetical protein